MARKLKLEDSDYILEIEKPNGETLRLEIVKSTIGNQHHIEKSEKELRDRLIKEEINTTEYYVGVLNLVVNDFSDDEFKDFTIDQLLLISDEINSIRGLRGRTQEEKKTADS